ncbi:GNAT family N-acetyltransferase [Clostridium sp. 19966]|uniref:GNAT family N-acetyltransferase n=1 Tax=Clostridium sp. 19966 TaxID=2768166 RepID=UPI0028DF9FCC|nr:GNAT family N-acetyltransferase [Clostridium sp. 19966]MDT8715994.1 GNAT family N-acetyltransferase [Clostridium sp. 19966]
MIRKARLEEADTIMDLIKAAVKDLNDKNINQWDDIYPNKEVIEEDIKKQNLYVAAEEDIKGIIVLNEFQDKEYFDLKWRYTEGKPLVIHRLCVHPKAQGRGVAKALISFAESFAIENNYNFMRLDAFTENSISCSLYEKVGFEKAGLVNFRKGKFYCFEKAMS